MKKTTHESRRSGFTLVEILIVIVVIVILMGLVFKLTVVVTNQSATAKSVHRIQMLENCLSGFYAEYGQYPPVPSYGGTQPVRFEYPWVHGARPAVFQNLAGDWPPWGEENGQAVVYTFGLMAFLLPREAEVTNMYDCVNDTRLAKLYSGGQWGEYNTKTDPTTGLDTERDLTACKRWAPYLDGILHRWPYFDERTYRDKGGNEAGTYTNWYTTVLDGWDRELRYESLPPYQSYRIWSIGPDGQDGTPDDINRERSLD